MFVEALLATAIEIGPIYEQRSQYVAVRPFYAEENEVTDGLWPLFTRHRDWWRELLCLHYQENGERGYQFEVDPLWWNGRDDRTGESYWGLFPLYGEHPHALLMYDFQFALWPLYHSYRMPRERDWLETKAVLFPLLHWRSDGSWGLWPLYGLNHQRESDHRYALWPIVTWANYREDRDTSGAGYSWMFWPLWTEIEREREVGHMFLPPFFSYAETPSGWQLRAPWPIFEMEALANRDRFSIFPLYESVELKAYHDGEVRSSVTRFGWKLVELYDEETRVFPFWVSREDDSYVRLWPFWEREGRKARLFSLLPIRAVPAIDRNFAKFWTFYEQEEFPGITEHSLLWGILRWSTYND